MDFGFGSGYIIMGKLSLLENRYGPFKISLED